MLYYGLVFTAAIIFSFGLVLMQRPFFEFSFNATALLDAVLDDLSDEDTKQKNLLSKVGKLLASMLLGFILPLALTLSISLVPLFTYSFYSGLEPQLFDTTSLWFYSSLTLGGLIPFLIPFPKRNEDYSPWSKLLHRMILEHPFISKQLFFIERRLFLKSKPKSEKPFLLVTGLARAGTTALTQLLFKTGAFHSLSYANMPFLLAPNLWGKLYSPKSTELKERTHGDNLQFGLHTIEALEEPFFKCFTHNSFISEEKLRRHDLDQSLTDHYLNYQRLIASNNETTYLAKNNNLILRYESLRNAPINFSVLVVVRNPIDHAASLLRQHKRFSMLHDADPFSLEYMNWLGHHEFGNNHKPFDLGENLRSNYPLNDINYWLACWVEYYDYLKSISGDPNMFLVDYQKLAQKPNELLNTISGELNIKLESAPINTYRSAKSEAQEIDQQLLKRANGLYQDLSESFM